MQKKLSLCPRKDNDVIIIDFLSCFFLTFNPLLLFCISGKVQKVQQLIRWEHFGITFLARLISYNCSQLWAAMSRTCKQEQSKTYIKAYSLKGFKIWWSRGSGQASLNAIFQDGPTERHCATYLRNVFCWYVATADTLSCYDKERDALEVFCGISDVKFVKWLTQERSPILLILREKNT